MIIIIALLYDCIRTVSNYLTGAPLQGKHSVVESMSCIQQKKKKKIQIKFELLSFGDKANFSLCAKQRFEQITRM